MSKNGQYFYDITLLAIDLLLHYILLTFLTPEFFNRI